VSWVRDDQPCSRCEDALAAFCDLYQGEFCDLKDRYYSDSSMGPDAVLFELTRLATPEQCNEVQRALVVKGHRLAHGNVTG